MTTSLEVALAEHLLPHEECEKRWGAFLSLTERYMGSPPKFLSFAHLSPLTYTFFLGSFRKCFRIPQCDIGLSKLNARARRMVLLEGSIEQNCAYCTGHMAILGDAVKGPLSQQCFRAGGVEKLKDLANDKPEDAILKRFVREVCTYPASLSTQTKADFVRVYGAHGVDEITTMIAFTGWLNFATDSAGMRLESRMGPFAEYVLRSRNLPFKLSDVVADDAEEKALGEKDLEHVEGAWSAGVPARFGAHIVNAWGMMAMTPSVASALATERNWFLGIPAKGSHLDAWLFDRIGCLPNVFHKAEDIVLKRVLAFGFRAIFIDDENCSWSRAAKCAFLYVFAQCVQNEELASDAINLCIVVAESDSDVLSDLNEIYHQAVSEGKATDALSAAVKYVSACAGPGGRITQVHKDELLTNVDKPEAVVDLIGIIAFSAFLHRVSVIVSCPAS